MGNTFMTDALHLPWLLVATPLLQDDNFKHAVVMIVEQSNHGAMGFVINRPVGHPVRDMVQADELDIPAELPAWYGGPVGADNGIILHNQISETGFDEEEFAGHFALTASEEALESMAEYARKRAHHLDADATCLHPYRFLVGYAGWGLGQLETEIREGAWIQLPFCEELVFNTPWTRMWELAMSKVGVAPHQYAHTDSSYLN